jgi:hypothetical protein
MTRQNGKVVVAVQAPVVGVITGEKTLEQIITGGGGLGEPVPPAVETKPLPGNARLSGAALPPEARNGADAPAPEQPDGEASAEGDVKSAEGNDASAPQAAADASEGAAGGDAAANEAEAAKLVSLARNYANMGMKSKAAEKCRECIAEYPNTLAADDAKSLLATCE